MEEHKDQSANEEQSYPGYPSYPSKEDIYRNAEGEPMEEEESGRENPSLDDGLDIPGAELDDANEEIGAEDEENNYYSLGGDQHEDLEERED